MGGATWSHTQSAIPAKTAPVTVAMPTRRPTLLPVHANCIAIPAAVTNTTSAMTCARAASVPAQLVEAHQ